MVRTIRLAGLHLALVAMTLRALIPVGWMPNPSVAGGTPLTICTMDGPMHMVLGTDGQTHKPRPGDGRHHDTCPFAAAPHFATTPPPVALATRAATVSFAPATSRPSPIGAFQRYAPQSPRAPPRPV